MLKYRKCSHDIENNNRREIFAIIKLDLLFMNVNIVHSMTLGIIYIYPSSRFIYTDNF